MKLNQSPRLNADAALIRELREHAQQVNALSEGRMSARYTAGTAAPTTGQWAQGDFIANIAPAELGSAVSPYVIRGWQCIAGGTPGTWVQQRYLIDDEPTGTVAPTTGTWAVGDFVRNSAPTVNTFTGSVIHGWICTVGGIPGSWAECSYLSNAPTATAWTAPTLLNSWVNFGSPYNDAGYMKGANGFVHLRGLIKSGTTTLGTAFFNLPSGFRPSSEYIFTTSSNDLYGQARVETDGDVTFHVGSNTWFSLDGISFKAA